MITLRKGDDAADLAGVTHMAIGVSWDPSSGSSRGLLGKLKKKVGVDLDLVAIAMSGDDPVRLAGLDSLDPMKNGSLHHSGDATSGHASGDDETVTVDFAALPSPVTSIIFVAAAYKLHTSFEQARNVSFKVYDNTGGSSQVVADIWPNLLATGNANAVAKASRNGNTWTLEVLDKSGNVDRGVERSLLMFAKGK